MTLEPNTMATTPAGEQFDVKTQFEIVNDDNSEDPEKQNKIYEVKFKEMLRSRINQKPLPGDSGMEVKQVSYADELPTWKKDVRRRDLLKHQDPDPDYVEYDADTEDTLWMKAENEKRLKNGKQELSVESFERAIYLLEKESHFQCHEKSASVPSSSLPIRSAVDDVCCVCDNGDATDVNHIIYCDMCNIPVHQDCYGVPYIPEGQWLCRKCKLAPMDPVTCELCPVLHGAFKQTSEGKWAHVLCAKFLPEVSFGNAVFLEPIDGVRDALRRRVKLRCVVCRQRQGAPVQCAHRSCARSFHVTCAVHAGLNFSLSDKFKLLCHLHNNSDQNGPPLKRKKVDEMIKLARTSVDRAPPSISVPRISNETQKKIADMADIDVHALIRWWFFKRKMRSGVPLIRSLQVCTRLGMDPTTSAEEVAIQQGRAAIERMRLLCELIKKREKDKRDIAERWWQTFQYMAKPQEMLFAENIAWIQEQDTLKVFKNKVTIEGYSTIIKHPMDLGTMSRKEKEGKYETWEQLKDDVMLMFQNCDDYNTATKNPVYLHYGKKLRKVVEERFARADEYFKERQNKEVLRQCIQFDLYAILNERREPAGAPPPTVASRPFASFSTEGRRLSAQENASPKRRALLRTKYTNYRDNAIKSPLPIDSPATATEGEEMEGPLGDQNDQNDPRSNGERQHADVVIVEMHSPLRFVAGMIIDPTRVKWDQLVPKTVRDYKYPTEAKCVRLFSNDELLFDRDVSTLKILDIKNDSCEGIENAKLYVKGVLPD